MFCVAAEIPLHGLSSSFPFSFSLAILLLSNQLAHAGKDPHGPAVPAHPSEEAWVPPQPSIPPRERERMQLPPWVMSSSEVQALGFCRLQVQNRKVFSVCTHTNSLITQTCSTRVLGKAQVWEKSVRNSGRRGIWSESSLTCSSETP